MEEKSPLFLFKLKLYLTRLIKVCSFRRKKAYTFLPDSTALEEINKKLSWFKILTFRLRPDVTLGTAFIKAFYNFCLSIIQADVKTRGVEDSVDSLLELLHLLDKGALYAGQFKYMVNFEQFDQVATAYFQAYSILTRRYVAIYQYLFTDGKSFQSTVQDSDSRPKQMTQLEKIKNVALLAFLEASYDDFEEFYINNTPVLFNNRPVLKYKKPLPFECDKLFVLEPDIKYKRYLIEVYFNLKPFSYFTSDQASQEKAREMIAQVNKVFNFLQKKESFMIIGPSIKTNFKILVITYFYNNQVNKTKI